MRSIINGKDTLCILPTVFGKSLIYQALPKLAKMMKIHENPIVVILSPLAPLIDDQVKSANAMEYLGLTACAISHANFSDVSGGKFNLLFGTPESWIDNFKWREFIGSNLMVENLVCIVVDEVHKVTWYVK